MDLLEVLIRKKVLIHAITSFCTLFSIFYARSITPTYQATIGFLPPDEASLVEYFPDNIATTLPGEIKHTSSGEVIYEMQGGIKIPERNKSIFYKFLTALQCYRFQEKVFIEGNFLSRLVDGKPVIEMGKETLRAINRSMQIGE